MGKATAIFGGVLVLALLAGGLTEATLALGGKGSLANDTLLRPATTKPSATSSPTPASTASVSPSVAPTPTATPAGPTATTNSFVHLRAGKSTASAILTDLDGGTVVQLLPDADAQWQQVHYGTYTGYIFKTYLAY